ncbi:MAG: S9 family peptidase, partial [Proteobacteria bacterium]|nr:S9 family peptidase [Pseudomonadota bacterium]
MKNLYYLLTLWLLTGTVFAEQSNQLELLDVFNLEFVSDPQISPDGKQVIYTRNFKDVMTDKNHSNLWLVDFDGKNNRPLITGNHNAHSAKWSHDGEKIVYLSDHADDKTKLYLMWMDSRESVALTNTKIPPRQVAWSQDDKHVVFTQFVAKPKPSLIKMPNKPEGAEWNEPPIYIDDMTYRADGQGYLKQGNQQIFILSVDGGTPRQLTDTAHNHQSPVWSADKKSIFFTANLHKNHEFEPLNYEIYQLKLSDLSIVPLTERFGPDTGPQLSPDGQKIAYVGFDDSFQGHTVNKLYVMDIDGENEQLVSEDLDRSVQSMAWDSDSKGLYVQYTDQGDGKLAHLTLKGKITEIANQLGGLSLGRPYNAAAFSVSNNDRAAITLGGTAHPADLAVVNNKKVSRLTQLNQDLFSYKKLGAVKELWWQSSVDQRSIQGWLVTPPDFDAEKKYPLILEIHGGPFASYGSVFSAE